MRYEDLIRLEAYDTHFGGCKQILSSHCISSRRLRRVVESFHDLVFCNSLAKMRFFCYLLFIFGPLALREIYRMDYLFEDTTAIHWMMMTASLLICFRLQHRNLIDHLRVDGAWVFEGLWSGCLVVLMSCQLFGRSHPFFSGASFKGRRR